MNWYCFRFYAHLTDGSVRSVRVHAVGPHHGRFEASQLLATAGYRVLLLSEARPEAA